jgi:hypothetical protein
VSNNPDYKKKPKDKVKTKHKEVRLTRIIPRFDEEELVVRTKKFPGKGFKLTKDPREVKFTVDCLLRDKSLLFELDLLFDSGQIVTLTFSKNCIHFSGVKPSTTPVKAKSKDVNKKNKVLSKKKDTSVLLKATEPTSGSGLFGFIGGTRNYFLIYRHFEFYF